MEISAKTIEKKQRIRLRRFHILSHNLSQVMCLNKLAEKLEKSIMEKNIPDITDRLYAVKTRQELNVFISSPGDVSLERTIVQKVISQLNGSSYVGQYVLIARAYEGVVPPVVGAAPQFTVDNYMMLPQDADIFVCIMWCRMGTPFVDKNTNQKYQSGTEYEFLQAYKSSTERKRPIILLYQCIRPYPHDVNLQQLGSVRGFFESFIGTEGRFEGLYKQYVSEKEFELEIFRDLVAVLQHDFLSQTLLVPSGVSLAAAPLPQSTVILSTTVLRENFLEVNTELRNYPSSIGGRHSIQRAEASQIFQWIDSTEEKPRLGMLIDKPGSGKTVVMAQVLHKLEAKAIAVLAIKSDYLSGIKTDTDLQRRLDLPASIEKCVRALAAEEKVVILIDQLDALSVSLSQDFSALDTIYSLILTLIQIDNVRVVISCREFDLHFDPRLSTLEHQQYRSFTLSSLTPEQVVEPLEAVGLKNKSILTSKMMQLLSVPLHLRIFAELLLHQDQEILSEEFYSLQQLYDRLWDEHILSATIPHLNETINVLVESMQNQHQLSVPIGVLDKDVHKQAVIHLLRVNFIRKEKGNYVFFHQTFFDYCYARRFIAEGLSLTEVTFKSSQGLFERSQMLQVLAYLRLSNPQKYLTEISTLLFSGNLRVHLRILLIEWFASLPDPNQDERVIAGKLLHNSQDQGDFLNAAQGNTRWFDKLNDGFIASLLHNGDEQKVSLASRNYLSSLITQRTDQILSLLEPYQGRSTSWDNIILYCLSRLEKWNG